MTKIEELETQRDALDKRINKALEKKRKSYIKFAKNNLSPNSNTIEGQMELYLYRLKNTDLIWCEQAISLIKSFFFNWGERREKYKLMM